MTKSPFWFLLILNLLFCELTVAVSSDQCDSENICTISRILIDDKGNATPVPYSFKYRAPKNGAPTVVVIPGGPGQSSTPYDIKRIFNLPEDFGIIQTDPMFVGVNKRNDMDTFKKATTSVQVAKDIELALQTAEISDIIIYGGSYGTIPGTILASNLSKSGKAPRAVILDGTAGRALSNKEAIQGYATQWERVKSQNSKEALIAFNKIVLQLKSEGVLNEEELTNILQLLLVSDSDKLSRIIYYAGRGDIKFARELLVELKDRANRPYSDDDKWFHGVISCREILPQSNPDGPVMKYNYKGHFESVPLSKDCSKYFSEGSVQLYDSKYFQISAPVIYLQGEDDPATPQWQAEYHAKNQKNMNRVLKVVPHGKHISLMHELNNCSSAFFRALQIQPQTASRSLEPCLEEQKALDQKTTVGSK